MISIRIVLGFNQVEKFIPELLKVCENKKVVIKYRQIMRISFLQGELTGVLSGDNANYVFGWIEGYGKSVELNKPESKKVAPAK